MKTLDDAIVELGGVLPSRLKNKFNPEGDWYISTRGKLAHVEVCVWFELSQFQQRAKELGFVNGYRWGVEYKNTGDEPLINDDVLIEVYSTADEQWNLGPCSLWNFRARTITAFKITDQRYKPADTSYLDKPESSIDSDTDWYDYDNRDMKALPDNNADVELLCGGSYQTRVEYIGIRGFKVVFYRYDTHEIDHAELPTASFRPLDWNRKAEAEKRRVVDAVWEAYHELGDLSVRATFDAMYDAGYLRLPANND
jgi:hypothetical protein